MQTYGSIPQIEYTTVKDAIGTEKYVVAEI